MHAVVTHSASTMYVCKAAVCAIMPSVDRQAFRPLSARSLGRSLVTQCSAPVSHTCSTQRARMTVNAL